MDKDFTTFKAFRNHTPDYLSGLLHEYMPGRSLRSSNSSLLAAPFSSTVESGRAYRSAAPLVWNALPIELCSMLCLNYFKQYIKTCLFNEALLTCACSSERFYTQVFTSPRSLYCVWYCNAVYESQAKI